jgi:hypothetical protein
MDLAVDMGIANYFGRVVVLDLNITICGVNLIWIETAVLSLFLIENFITSGTQLLSGWLRYEVSLQWFWAWIK